MIIWNGVPGWETNKKNSKIVEVCHVKVKKGLNSCITAGRCSFSILPDRFTLVIHCPGFMFDDLAMHFAAVLKWNSTSVFLR